MVNDFILHLYILNLNYHHIKMYERQLFNTKLPDLPDEKIDYILIHKFRMDHWPAGMKIFPYHYIILSINMYI